jgi:hypothetical protein
MQEVAGHPLHERLDMVGDRPGRSAVDMREDRIEHRARACRHLGHQRSEFAIEVAEEQERVGAEYRETRVVDRTDSVVCLEQGRHHG